MSNTDGKTPQKRRRVDVSMSEDASVVSTATSVVAPHPQSNTASSSSSAGAAGVSVSASTGDAVMSELTDIQRQFQVFSDTMDERNAKKERIYKTTRDITKKSKDVISFLHRLPVRPLVESKTNTDTDTTTETTSESNPTAVAATATATATTAIESKLERGFVDGDKKLRAVEILIVQVNSELSCMDEYHRYWRNFSFGLQEYLEAISYWWFLQYGTLIPPHIVEKRIAKHTETHAVPFVLSELDYLLGVSDLPGELMRYATNAVPKGAYHIPVQVRDFLQAMMSGFATLDVPHREISKKVKVMKQSLQKVETLCYKIKIRGAEFPTSMLANILKQPSTNEPQDE
jgi:predicted translin family RNA/ssDNA-binding protein